MEKGCEYRTGISGSLSKLKGTKGKVLIKKSGSRRKLIISCAAAALFFRVLIQAVRLSIKNLAASERGISLL